MAKPKGKARMYVKDVDGNIQGLGGDGPISEKTREYMRRLSLPVRISTPVAWLVPCRVIQPGTPFSYN